MRSILTDNLKVCYLCGSTENVDLHHCVHDSTKEWRNLSTQYHLVVGLCYQCHRGPNGVHNKQNGVANDLRLRQDAQRAWEARRIRKKNISESAAREAWVRIFQHDYLGGTL